MKDFDRIAHDPQVMGGKPTIRGMRVTVGALVGLIGAGHTIEEVLADLTPTWSVKTCSRRCATRLGGPKRRKSRCPTHESAGRHESLSALGGADSGGGNRKLILSPARWVRRRSKSVLYFPLPLTITSGPPEPAVRS